MPKLGLLAGIELVKDLEEFHALLITWPSDVQQLPGTGRPAGLSNLGIYIFTLLILNV